jgi:hypothetical protein
MGTAGGLSLAPKASQPRRIKIARGVHRVHAAGTGALNAAMVKKGGSGGGGAVRDLASTR